MVGTGQFEKLLEVIDGLPRLMLEVTLSSGNELLIGVIGLLVIAALIIAGTNHNSLGSPLCPLLSPLALLFMPLLTTLWDAPRPLLGATFLSPWMKMALTASSLEACLVAMPSSCFMVFG
jgi:hypothetical protein